MKLKRNIKINTRSIGDGNPVFIVFEAGPTHSGLDSAKKLVKHAVEAGADAVKFQVLDPDRLVSDKSQLISFDILLDKKTGKTETVSEPLYNILQQRCMSRREWSDLKRYCDDMGIVFFSTATFYDEVDFLADIGCETVKVCSGDIDYFQLIRYCANKNLCLQFDTGNATLGEVEQAVDEARNMGNNKIIIHNCPSGYPARLESINLRLISTLKQMFECPVAFSDHTPGWEMDIAAVALGANMVEKTITLDRTTPSVEHVFSIEPKDMIEFVRSIRNLETALGNSRRILSNEEREKATAVRRSLILKDDLPAGTIINERSVEFSRPGSGIRPGFADLIWNKRLKKNMKKGTILSFMDVK